MMADYLRIGVSNLRKRQLRTWLTMIGIFIGIALVVFIVTMGEGLQQYIDESFTSLGRDKIFIMPKGQFGPGTETEVKLGEDDLNAIRRTRGVADASGMLYRTGQIKFKDQVRYVFFIGRPAGEDGRLIEEMYSNFDIEVGRDFKQGDRREVVLGRYYLDRDIFKPNVRLRDTVTLNGMDFTVVGFFELIGNPDDDRSVHVPNEQLREIFGIEEEQYDQIVVKIEPSEKPLEVAERIEKSLRRERGLDEGKEDFSISTTEDLMETFSTIVLTVQVVLGFLASISLLVGGIGIMNTMFTAVLERTREIGVMKAIGAKNSDIMTIFLIESGVLGLVGGLIGIGIGFGIAKYVEYALVHYAQITFLQAYFPWYYAVGILLFSIVVGTLSGILPARRASRMSPVDSLRYE